jgi:hypothetical protein
MKETVVSGLRVKEIVSGAGDGDRTRDPLLGRQMALQTTPSLTNDIGAYVSLKPMKPAEPNRDYRSLVRNTYDHIVADFNRARVSESGVELASGPGNLAIAGVGAVLVVLAAGGWCVGRRSR